MKKSLRIIAVVLLLALVFSFVACNSSEQDEENSTKSVVLLVVNGDEELARYEREVDYDNLSELLLSLTKEDNSEFQFESSTSFYGQFVKSITVSTNSETWEREGLFPDKANNEFCALYHTLDNVENRDYTIEPKTFNETEFYSSLNGTIKTPLVDGAKYMFTICSF